MPPAEAPGASLSPAPSAACPRLPVSIAAAPGSVNTAHPADSVACRGFITSLCISSTGWERFHLGAAKCQLGPGAARCPPGSPSLCRERGAAGRWAGSRDLGWGCGTGAVFDLGIAGRDKEPHAKHLGGKAEGQPTDVPLHRNELVPRCSAWLLEAQGWGCARCAPQLWLSTCPHDARVWADTGGPWVVERLRSSAHSLGGGQDWGPGKPDQLKLGQKLCRCASVRASESTDCWVGSPSSAPLGNL